MEIHISISEYISIYLNKMLYTVKLLQSFTMERNFHLVLSLTLQILFLPNVCSNDLQNKRLNVVVSYSLDMSISYLKVPNIEQSKRRGKLYKIVNTQSNEKVIHKTKSAYFLIPDL